MYCIQDLKNIGRQKTALIIGNGHSVNDFNFGSINSDIMVIGINNYKPIDCDYIVHYDNNIHGIPCNEYYMSKGKTKIISFVDNKHEYTDYTFNVKHDVIFMDSGSHALQIVSNIMKFETIYLIGYDYEDRNGRLRWSDKRDATENEKDLYERCIFTRALHKYNHPNCKHHELNKCDCDNENIFDCENIYNLNVNSKLMLFPYKNLKEI